MAKFQVTFEDRKGKKSTMTVEDLNSGEARAQATFFQNSYGRVIDVKPATTK